MVPPLRLAPGTPHCDHVIIINAWIVSWVPCHLSKPLSFCQHTHLHRDTHLSWKPMVSVIPSGSVLGGAP